MLYFFFDYFTDGKVRFDFTNLYLDAVSDLCVGNDNHITSFDTSNTITLFTNILNLDIAEFFRFNRWLRL